MPILRQTLRVNRRIKCPECKRVIYRLNKSISAGEQIKHDDLSPMSETTSLNNFYCPHCKSPWISLESGRIYSK